MSTLASMLTNASPLKKQTRSMGPLLYCACRLSRVVPPLQLDCPRRRKSRASGSVSVSVSVSVSESISLSASESLSVSVSLSLSVSDDVSPGSVVSYGRISRRRRVAALALGLAGNRLTISSRDWISRAVWPRVRWVSALLHKTSFARVPFGCLRRYCLKCRSAARGRPRRFNSKRPRETRDVIASSLAG